MYLSFAVAVLAILNGALKSIKNLSTDTIENAQYRFLLPFVILAVASCAILFWVP